jgi:hypothetical protein
MGRVNNKVCRFFLPAFYYVFIRCEFLQGFEAFGEVIGMQDLMEMLS